MIIQQNKHTIYPNVQPTRKLFFIFLFDIFKKYLQNSSCDQNVRVIVSQNLKIISLQLIAAPIHKRYSSL